MIPLNPRPAASKSAASARRVRTPRISAATAATACSPGRQARVTEKLKECESRASGGGIKAPGSGWSIDAPQVEGLPDREFPRSCGAGRQPVFAAHPDLSVRATRRRRSRGGILLRKASGHRMHAATQRVRTAGCSILCRRVWPPSIFRHSMCQGSIMFMPVVRPRSSNSAYGGEVAPVRRTGAVTLGTKRGGRIRSRPDLNPRVNRSTVPGERAASGGRGLRHSCKN